MNVPGDPRDIYIARFGWANSDEVILQQLNRLQNTNNLWLANAKSGKVHLMFQDRDEAWVDINNTFTWPENRTRLLYISERDGWRHAYAISRDGAARLITTGSFDILSLYQQTKRIIGSITSRHRKTPRNGISIAPGSTAAARLNV